MLAGMGTARLSRRDDAKDRSQRAEEPGAVATEGGHTRTALTNKLRARRWRKPVPEAQPRSA